MEDTILHTKYRPKNVEELIGHEEAVTRIKGMIAKNKFPNAMLFTGPPSVGKTTLARAIAGTVNGKPVEEQGGDYKELNAADSRSIDDMRELIRVSKFKPMGKRRIIVIDEAHQLVANKAAADALLKPLEDSGTTQTMWILCSMDAAKFRTGTTGPALAKRCTQFVLSPHTNSDLLKQAKRIVKGEKLKYLQEDDLLKTIVKRSDSEMRTLASLIGTVSDYYDGLEKKPKELKLDTLLEVLESVEDADEKMALQIVVGALTGSFTNVQKGILGAGDHFMLIKKLMWVAQFLLNVQVMDGAKHPKIMWYGLNRDVHNALKNVKLSLGVYAAFNECMVDISQAASTFSVGADALLSAKLYRFIKDVMVPVLKKDK